ncbi:hypothetical protein HF086_002481 [Spodoptera exigua]|uniref:STAT transcription factor all-alpha domain-containing protein n=1 Tax=Spodoptera exigua TaxID=7107 RepID=A0A922MFV6_SPOEX|nr:hypothetical protein HF086_002481 [Spodoptera exigua]
MELVDHMKENIANLRQLQSQVLDEELIKWKREQQLSGNGVPMQSNLNTIQEWCELLADLIWTTRQQVNNVARINTKTIVELRQPHLAEMLDEMSKQVVIISEQQAQLLLKSETQAGKGKQPVECGDILNNTGSMEYQPTSRQLSVSFR